MTPSARSLRASKEKETVSKCHRAGRAWIVTLKSFPEEEQERNHTHTRMKMSRRSVFAANVVIPIGSLNGKEKEKAVSSTQEPLQDQTKPNQEEKGKRIFLSESLLRNLVGKEEEGKRTSSREQVFKPQ